MENSEFWKERGGRGKLSNPLRLSCPPHQVRGPRNDRFGSVEANYFMLPLMIIVVVFF
jgi:hypothetical protein